MAEKRDQEQSRQQARRDQDRVHSRLHLDDEELGIIDDLPFSHGNNLPVTCGQRHEHLKASQVVVLDVYRRLSFANKATPRGGSGFNGAEEVLASAIHFQTTATVGGCNYFDAQREVVPRRTQGDALPPFFVTARKRFQQYILTFKARDVQHALCQC